MTRDLIFSQCMLRTEEQQRLMAVSLQLAHRLNPGVDFMVIDNASLLPLPLPLGPTIRVHRFEDSIGHFSPKFRHERPNPQDGPGRAIMTALRIAIDSGYERACYLESDVLYAKPIAWGFERMTKKTACLPRTKWGYLDWSPWWIADLPWLDEIRFIERYDWPAQTGGPGNEGERIYERLLVSSLEVLPVTGGRGEGHYDSQGGWHEGHLTAHNLRAIYPEGIDFITHCSHDCRVEFLKMNGLDDLAEKL